MVKNPDNVKRGKKARLSGAEFERRTRKDLESQGWIVDRWMNNVELGLSAKESVEMYRCESVKVPSKLIPAKASRFRLSSTGFPDFIIFKSVVNLVRELAIKQNQIPSPIMLNKYEIIGVEVKTNGYLDKTEREKCQWYLNNNIFSKILIASKYKEKNRVKIKYTDFEEKYGK